MMEQSERGQSLTSVSLCGVYSVNLTESGSAREGSPNEVFSILWWLCRCRWGIILKGKQTHPLVVVPFPSKWDSGLCKSESIPQTLPHVWLWVCVCFCQSLDDDSLIEIEPGTNMATENDQFRICICHFWGLP